MSLSPGTRIGAYEVVAAIGAGGMGEVYRARDTRLNRSVAIKALHDVVAGDPERVARFEREAQLLASLNHSNIAAIHGIEEREGAKYLVLEYIDGRLLSDVIRDSGALPVGEALAIARQIADALAASHERGIIHRDLKPGNVMITADGQVKVLDFGLGKAIEGDGSRAHDQAPSAGPANSPTMTLAATQAGIILGTAGYMSPEQAKGRAADKRSDVWAFGCVLFELVTGRRAFEGEDITETLAAIVRGEPDWTALPASLPPVIRTLVERCLVKNRADRLSDMSVVRFLLSEPAITSPAQAPSTPVAPARGRSIGWPGAAAMVVVAMAATAGLMSVVSPGAAPPAPGAVSRLSIALPSGDEVTTTNVMPIAVSPDGTMVTYVGLRGGGQQLYLRVLEELEARPLAGTEGAAMPFFSPDSRWIAFFAQGKLKKVAVGGGGLQVISDEAIDPRGGTWGTDDQIYFAPTNVSGIVKIASSGGPATEVTRPDRGKGEMSHRWPHVLADQQILLFGIWTGPGYDERQIVAESLATGGRRVLVPGGDSPRYVAGHLVYTRLDKLFAVPWRPSDPDLGGAAPVELPDRPRLENEGGGAYAVSEAGTMAYLAGGPNRYALRLVWVDRAGNVEPLPVPERNYESATISPDGRFAMVQIMEGTAGLWLYDFARNTLAPFVTGGGSSQAATWTPDGARVVYRGTRTGLRNLYVKAADGTGDEERLTTKEDATQTPTSISGDGEWLAFYDVGGQPRSDGDVFLLRLTGDRTPLAVVTTPARDVGGQIHPGGSWLAYQSAVSGRAEIYVQPFPEKGPSQLVSVDGGTEPLWSLDGKELFYVSGDALMVVDVTTAGGFSAGQPRVLFRGRFRPSANGNTPYAISPDGRRFLRVQQVEPERAATRIEVVQNWAPTIGSVR